MVRGFESVWFLLWMFKFREDFVFRFMSWSFVFKVRFVMEIILLELCYRGVIFFLFGFERGDDVVVFREVVLSWLGL